MTRRVGCALLTSDFEKLRTSVSLGNQWAHLLTWRALKPRLATGGIRTLMVSLGHLATPKSPGQVRRARHLLTLRFRWSATVDRRPKPLVCCCVDKFFVQPMTTVVTPPNLPPHQPTRNCASRYNDAPEMPIRCPRRALVQSEHADVVRYEADGYHRDPLAQSTRDTGFPLEEGAATVVNKVPTSGPICDHCDIFAAPAG
jgi:hypothetical protein